MGRASARHELHELLDAIYNIEGTDGAWLGGMITAARPLIDDGLGIGAWTFHNGPKGVFINCTVDDSALPLTAMGIELASKDPELVRRGHLGPPIATFSESVGRANLRRSQAMESVNRTRAVHDYLTVLAKEPDGWGVAISTPLRTVRRIASSRRTSLQRIAGHIQAAHRLRRRIAAKPADPVMDRTASTDSGNHVRWSDAVDALGGATETAPVQAVLAPSGRILDAKADARDVRDREVLQRAAIAVDRARAKMLRGRADDEALGEWRALVDGRWSLVDRLDTDGRRFLLARRNAPGTLPHPLLDERERAVLGYRCAGHPLKLIAYEMGFSIALTSRLLKAAMQKLGLRSAAELVAFMAAPPVPSGPVS